MNRSRSYTIAALLNLLLSITNIVGGLIFLPRGAVALDHSIDSPPYAVIVLAIILGVVGLVSTYGLWQNQKWGVVLTILVRVIDILSALPGVLFAPTIILRFASITSVILGAIVIILLLRRGARGAVV